MDVLVVFIIIPILLLFTTSLILISFGFMALIPQYPFLLQNISLGISLVNIGIILLLVVAMFKLHLIN